MKVQDYYEKLNNQFSLGTYLSIYGHPYMVVQCGPGKLVVVNLTSGSYWAYAADVKDICDVTVTEAKELLSSAYDVAEFISADEAAELLIRHRSST